MNQKEAFIIAVSNLKGGVAKTTTALSIAGLLASKNLDVLLIDLDTQANLTLGLGIDPKHVYTGISEVLFNSSTLLKASRETDIPSLDLVPSNEKMELAERFLPMRKDYELLLRNAIYQNGSNDSASSFYDFIIIDCPPAIGAVTLNAFSAAHLLIIPTQTEYFSAYALKPMLTHVKKIRNRFNNNLEFRLLITMYDKRNKIHKQVRKQLESTFSDSTFQTIIGVDTKLRESSAAGLPINFYAAKSRGTMQYESLTQEVLKLSNNYKFNPIESQTVGFYAK